MSDEANTEPKFAFPKEIVTATRLPSPLTLNQIWGNIIKPFTAIAPTNSAFIDATISWEDIGNGYTLDYNSNGILWRVNAAGIPHPDDLEKFYEQQEIIQGYSDNLAAELKSNINLDKVRMDDAADIFEGSSNAEDRNVAQDTKAGSDPLEFKLGYTQSDGTPFFYANKDVIVQESSKAGTSWLKAPEYTTQSYKGRTYNIYVPLFCDEDINSGGWRTIDIHDTTLWDFNFSRFASGIAAPNVNVKPIVEAGDDTVYLHRPNPQGVATLSGASLIIGTGDSFLKSLDKTPIRVIMQENNGYTRIIIQVGLNNRFFQENAGKTVTGSEDALTNMAFRLTLDARHAQDPFTAFISITDNGQIVVIPKVYSGDKYEVGKSGFWGGYDFKERSISPTIIGNNGPYQSLAKKLEEIFSR